MDTKTRSYLLDVGKRDDADIDLIEAALALSFKESVDQNFYKKQIEEISRNLTQSFEKLCAKDNGDSVHIMAKALKAVFADDYGYIGDETHYDDFENINLFDAMDRQKGLPITLCILAIGLCRLQGWAAEGVNFPGHFIMRLSKDGEAVMIDPFQGCEILEAKDLRFILKRVMGEYAELSSSYYESCDNRDILLRLQNNKKFRLIDLEDYQGALKIVETMEWIAPNDYRLWLDKAVLLSRVDQPKAAIENLKAYIDIVQDPRDKVDAQEFLMQLQNQLN